MITPCSLKQPQPLITLYNEAHTYENLKYSLNMRGQQENGMLILK